MNIITYHSINATPAKAWLAQIMLDSGDYWGVYCTAATEGEVRAKAYDLWVSEKARLSKSPTAADAMIMGFKSREPYIEPTKALNDPWKDAAKQHHLAGKVWLIHKQTREKIRVEPNDIRISNGDWERGGPRSK